MRRLFLILFLSGCMVTTVHPVLPRTFTLSPQAEQSAQEYANLSADAHAEWLACVANYHVVETPDHVRIVIDSISDTDDRWSSDNLQIWASGNPCHHQPVMHSHVEDNGYLDIPSETDRQSLGLRGTAFDALLSVHADSTWAFHLYYP